MQITSKRRRADGEQASPFWGGANNPDGTTKKVAKYDTAPKRKRGRRKVCEQRAATEKKQVHKLFVQRRDELTKIGQWRGSNVFGKWLMQLALRVLQGDDEGTAAQQMPKVRSLLMFVC